MQPGGQHQPAKGSDPAHCVTSKNSNLIHCFNKMYCYSYLSTCHAVLLRVAGPMLDTLS